MVVGMQKSLQTQPLPSPSITTGCGEGVLSLDGRNLQNQGCSAPSPLAAALSPAGSLSCSSATHQTPRKVEVWWSGLAHPTSSWYKPCTTDMGRCSLPAAPAAFADGISNTQTHSQCFILTAPWPIRELPNRMSCHVIFICTVLQMLESWLGSQAKLHADLKEHWPLYQQLP